MFKVTIELNYIICYNFHMKYKITAFIGLFTLIGCSPKQVTIFKKYISEHNLTLTKLDDNSSYLTGTNIIIVPKEEFKNGTFKGFDGCNDYNGTFTLNRDYINFYIKEIDHNPCTEVDTENLYLKKLAKSKKILIKGEKIFFQDKNENWLMSFKKRKK